MFFFFKEMASCFYVNSLVDTHCMALSAGRRSTLAFTPVSPISKIIGSLINKYISFINENHCKIWNRLKNPFEICNFIYHSVRFSFLNLLGHILGLIHSLNTFTNKLIIITRCSFEVKN